MSFKVPVKKVKEKSFQVPEENYTNQLKEVYSFSTTDNNIQVKYISPDDFLYETYKESKINNPKDTKTFEEYRKEVIFKNKVEGIKDVLQGKKESPYRLPIPFLEYDSKGNQIGHEGRHTSQALKELGVKKMPVTIVTRK